MSRKLTLDFLKTEAASGLILAGAALVAILLANSPWRESYFAFVHSPFTLQAGGFEETKSVLKWTKDGLMAVFFFVVGLEIKYEILKGELSNPRKLAMPVFAAVGGMVAPALVFLAFNLGEGGHPNGWPIPTATDIAFALAALAIAAPRAPPALRVFLLTLAIADDLGAVMLIAILFTSDINLPALAGALTGLAFMVWIGRWKQVPPLLFAAAFLVVWAFTLKSGVNTSLAGVAAALTVPIKPRRDGGEGGRVLVQRLPGGGHTGAPAAGHRHGPAARQADRRVRRRPPRLGPEARPASQWVHVATTVRRVDALRRRIHDEPVHRRPRFPRHGHRLGGAARRGGGLASVGVGRGSDAETRGARPPRPVNAVF
jgi:Na+/H+ antiporter NhaA